MLESAARHKQRAGSPVIMIKVSLVIALAASAQAFHLRPSKVPLQRITHSRFKASTAVLEPDVRADEFASGSEVSHFETSSSIRPIDSLHLGAIRKALPKEVFEKSLSKSLYYMFKDYAIWGSAVLAFSTLVKSSLWARMPFLGKAAATFVYSQVCGLMMWCVFVVGHDCGHTTFSNNKLLNDILGHVTHGSLMVPFYPWQLSHRRHHMFHNHESKDYSYKWYTPEIVAANKSPLVNSFALNPAFTVPFPFFGWPMYLLGIDDGSHFWPAKSQRLWASAPAVESRKCILSAAVVAAFAGLFYTLAGSLSNLALYYAGPYVMFGWWLVCVTYFQHHGPETKVYDDGNWDYVTAAFETVDRKFGKGIDHLHHHITDGHVAHHLFFTQIPHYNLPQATKALQKYLGDKGLGHIYRYSETLDFPQRLHAYLRTTGFRAVKAPALPAVAV